MDEFMEIEGVFYRRSAFDAFHFIEEAAYQPGDILRGGDNGFLLTGTAPDRLVPTGNWELVGFCAGAWHRINTFPSQAEARLYARRVFNVPT